MAQFWIPSGPVQYNDMLMVVAYAWYNITGKVGGCSTGHQKVSDQRCGGGGLCVAGPFAGIGRVNDRFASETEVALVAKRFLRWCTVAPPVPPWIVVVGCCRACIPTY